MHLAEQEEVLKDRLAGKCSLSGVLGHVAWALRTLLMYVPFPPSGLMPINWQVREAGLRTIQPRTAPAQGADGSANVWA